jgi:hypothetical protein
MTQPEALRLADCLETEKVGAILGDSAAAELRRLQSLNTELLAALKKAYHAMVHVELSDSSRQEWEDARTTAHGAIVRAEGEAK